MKTRYNFLPRSPFTLVILFFLATALIGVWAAYDRASAWSAFWVILGSVLLFFIIAQQPSSNLPFVSGVLSLYGACLAVYFLLSHDWGTQPADFEILNCAALKWFSWRLPFNVPWLHPNQVAGILAVIFPLSIALNHHTRTARPLGILLLLVNGIIFTGIIFTSSRAAWLAIVAGFSAWFLWKVSLYLSQKFALHASKIFLVWIILLVSGIVFIGASRANQIADALGSIPGSSSSESRLELYKNAVYLIADFPLTGGGLHSFSGLYSQYMLVLPVFIFGYSHNLYLDIAIEQGVIGAASWIVLLIFCVYSFSQFFRYYQDYPAFSQRFIPFLMAAFVILCLHGLVDNPFAEDWAKPLLFVIPGFLIASGKPVMKRKSKPAVSLKVLVPLILIAGLTGFIVYQARVHPILLANIGAVKMAQIDLGDFPAGEWDDGSESAAYTESEQYFIDTIGIDPDNTTANYRLGLISMLRRDFERAVGYLEVAYGVSPNHRGIIKSLGYCYTWLGQLDKAEVILAKINETQAEMRTYAWWWQSQGYPQYAEQASQMAERLEAAELSQ